MIDPLIVAFNHLEILHLSRVPDWTDLMALTILPISYLYLRSLPHKKVRLTALPIMIIASFSFIATSRSPMPELKFDKEYSFQYSIDSLKKRIFFHPNITNNYNIDEWMRLDSIERNLKVYPQKHYAKRKKDLFDTYCNRPIYIDIEDTNHICNNVIARISLHQNREISTLKLLDIRYRNCTHIEGKEDKEIIQEIFEEKIIHPLNE